MFVEIGLECKGFIASFAIEVFESRMGLHDLLSNPAKIQMGFQKSRMDLEGIRVKRRMGVE